MRILLKKTSAKLIIIIELTGIAAQSSEYEQK
jgi:hypothetical protein